MHRLLPRWFALLFLSTLVVRAETDPAALEKQRADIDRRERRESQKVDQAEEQERIKLRTRERDELAKVQRDITAAAGATTATVVATGSMSAVDTAKFAQLKFAEDEVHNLINNQLTPEMSARIQKDRNAIARKFNLERAKLPALLSKRPTFLLQQPYLAV